MPPPPPPPPPHAARKRTRLSAQTECLIGNPLFGTSAGRVSQATKRITELDRPAPPRSPGSGCLRTGEAEPFGSPHPALAVYNSENNNCVLISINEYQGGIQHPPLPSDARPRPVALQLSPFHPMVDRSTVHPSRRDNAVFDINCRTRHIRTAPLLRSVQFSVDIDGWSFLDKIDKIDDK